MTLLFLFLVATCVVFVPFYFVRNIGVNFADEGYLWYGTLQTLKGRLPIRDFRAYDPGRYYWCAAICRATSEGLVSLRFAMKLFMWLTLLMLAGYLYSCNVPSALIVLIMALISINSGAFHKQMDAAWPVINVIVLSFALQDISLVFPILVLGGFIGLSFFIGLNHLIYTAAALGLSAILAVIKGAAIMAWLNVMPWLLLGFAIGCIPFGLLFLKKDYAKSYVERKIKPIMVRGTSNLKLPIPWPWQTKYPQNKGTKGHDWSLRWLMLFIPLVYGVVVYIYLVQDEEGVSKVLLASTVTGIGYLNHIYSRADRGHVLVGLPPFMITTLLLFGVSPILGGMLLLGLFIVSYHLSIRQEFAPFITKTIKKFKRLSMGGDEFLVPNNMALLPLFLDRLTKAYLQEDNLFMAPTIVGLYPYLGKDAPFYDTFSIYPASNEKQLEMIAVIKEGTTRACVIDNAPLDQRRALMFENTHPLVWKYMNDNLDKKEVEEIPAHYILFFKPSA